MKDDKFRLTPIPLQTVRPFVFEDVSLAEYMPEGSGDAEVVDFLSQRVGCLISLTLDASDRILWG